jgi:hypothetical protein
MADAVLKELIRFETGEIDPAAFPHREHLRLGFEMLRRFTFTEAAHRYSIGLQRMTARAGRPDAYHATTTVAFLSLIGERIAANDAADFMAFERANPDLLDKGILNRWYGRTMLSSAPARRTFLLPAPLENRL